MQALHSPENILGICLMAVNEWVNVLGGNLQIVSKKGEGCTFIFTLPLKPKALATSRSGIPRRFHQPAKTSHPSPSRPASNP